MEPGQTRAQFQSDLEQAARMAGRMGLRLESLVFPRNQSNPEYLSLLPPAGIRCYRGNEQHRLYRAAAEHDQKLWMRAARLLDAYLPLTGHNVHDLDTLATDQPFNIPASRFLRPHAPVAAWFEPLRKRRITRAMEAAARTGGLFHLWWHPHNFGRQTETNLAFLDDILAHFEHLRDRHGMRSLTMSEVADVLRDRADQRRDRLTATIPEVVPQGRNVVVRAVRDAGVGMACNGPGRHRWPGSPRPAFLLAGSSPSRPWTRSCHRPPGAGVPAR